ncbi:MAG: 2-amino-4-hydroxy-6-hydroxymethyldihydropteridine diphosphokinase [Actinomycetota bacterium]
MSGSRVFVGLGSNVGDRLAFLKAAVAALRATPGVEVARTSSVYETDPVGAEDQPMFLNAVAEVRTELPPADLLGRLKQIEADVGRTPGQDWGPREIDLDLLMYDDEMIDEGDLEVPHPEMAHRSFVLVPLLEIDRDVAIPGIGPARMRDMMLGRAGVRLAHPPHLL